MFYIDKVHYAKDVYGNKMYISKVKGTTVLTEDSTKEYTKQAVIDFINDGNAVKTKCRKNYSWVVGEDVHVVDNRYIRTDSNYIKADNLENLPEY